MDREVDGFRYLSPNMIRPFVRYFFEKCFLHHEQSVPHLVAAIQSAFGSNGNSDILIASLGKALVMNKEQAG